MDDIARFERFADPRATLLRDVGKKGFTTLIAAGIVNPFGPTLTVVAADGDFRVAQGALSILHIILNPFSRSCDVVGKVDVKDNWSPDDLQVFFSLPFGSCPTLLVPSYYFEPDQAVRFHARFLMGFEDGSNLLARVRKRPGDPWKRIEDDMSIAQTIARPTDAANRISRRLSEVEASELAALQLAPDNLKAELQAFMAAWDGALECVGRRPADVMSVEEFLDVFSRLAVTCNVPMMAD